MKIDVEGYEGKILNGARRVMRESDTVTMLELHSNSKLKASGITRCELLENLLVTAGAYIILAGTATRVACLFADYRGNT